MEQARNSRLGTILKVVPTPSSACFASGEAYWNHTKRKREREENPCHHLTVHPKLTTMAASIIKVALAMIH